MVLFLISFFTSMMLCVLVFDADPWLSMLISFLVASFILFIWELVKAWWNEANQPARRQRQPDEAPEPPRPRQRRNAPKLELIEMSLVQRMADGLSIAKYINCTRVTEIRPYAVIQVNDKALVGRRLPMKFQIVSPGGEVGYECVLNPVLTVGPNRIIPADSAMKVNRRIVQGDWHIQLLLSDRLWQTLVFSISPNSSSEIAKKLAGADLEMANNAETARVVDQLGPRDVDDLLK